MVSNHATTLIGLETQDSIKTKEEFHEFTLFSLSRLRVNNHQEMAAMLKVGLNLFAFSFGFRS